MKDETIQRTSDEQQPLAHPRRIDSDWTESEWFQVWLDLARRPYRKQKTQLEVAAQTP